MAKRPDLVEIMTLRNPAREDPVFAKADLEQNAMREIDLVLQAVEPRARALPEGGGRRIERTESCPGCAPRVHQERSEQNIARRQVDLGTRQVADSQAGGALLVFGQV